MVKKTISLKSHSRSETQRIAEALGSLLKSGTLITLKGDLGAGKTTFTQGLAKGLGIEDKVNSPTFVIMKAYEGRLSLIHIDAYRLEGLDQDLGFEDYLDDEHIVIIEWSQYLDYLDDYEKQQIHLEHLGDDKRLITLELDSVLMDQLEKAL